jgi:hypothetical protein
MNDSHHRAYESFDMASQGGVERWAIYAVDSTFIVRLETSLPSVSISCETGTALSLNLDVLFVRENHGVPTPVVDRPVYESQLNASKARFNLK